MRRATFLGDALGEGPNILNGGEFRELTNALKAEDLKRRLNEAETFIKEHQNTSKAAQK